VDAPGLARTQGVDEAIHKAEMKRYTAGRDRTDEGCEVQCREKKKL
jgi:hypothetical protein